MLVVGWNCLFVFCSAQCIILLLMAPQNPLCHSYVDFCCSCVGWYLNNHIFVLWLTFIVQPTLLLHIMPMDHLLFRYYYQTFNLLTKLIYYKELVGDVMDSYYGSYSTFREQQRCNLEFVPHLLLLLGFSRYYYTRHVKVIWIINSYCEVIKNVVHVTASGLMATWYFLSGVGMPRNPTSLAFKRATTTSFGSICLGSLLVIYYYDYYWYLCKSNFV